MKYADRFCTYKEEAGNYIYTGTCIQTGKPYSVTIPGRALFAYRQGAMIQDAMPMLSTGDCEFLLSGYSPEGTELREQGKPPMAVPDGLFGNPNERLEQMLQSLERQRARDPERDPLKFSERGKLNLVPGAGFEKHKENIRKMTESMLDPSKGDPIVKVPVSGPWVHNKRSEAVQFLNKGVGANPYVVENFGTAEEMIPHPKHKFCNCSRTACQKPLRGEFWRIVNLPKYANNYGYRDYCIACGDRILDFGPNQEMKHERLNTETVEEMHGFGFFGENP